jgi:hypothetical protein
MRPHHVWTINTYLIEQAERAVHVLTQTTSRTRTRSSMRVLLATSILSSIAANAGPLEAAPALAGAPMDVRVQPRTGDFSPHSAANRAEQRKLSRFDARQKTLDSALDENLSICRC